MRELLKFKLVFRPNVMHSAIWWLKTANLATRQSHKAQGFTIMYAYNSQSGNDNFMQSMFRWFALHKSVRLPIPYN